MASSPAEKREARMVAGQRVPDPDALLDHPAELLDIFFDRMPMGIAVFDRDLVLRRCNPTWADFVGRYTETPVREVVPGKNFFDLAPGTEEATVPLFERVLSGETVRQDALLLQSGGGPLSYWDVVFTPLVEEGKVVGFIDVVTDATERTLAERELRQSEERFRSLVTNSSDMITVFTPDGTRLYASPSTQHILGYTPEDAIGGNYSDVVHPDDAPKVREEFAERARTPGTGRPFEFRARHADGSWRVLESVGTNRLEDPSIGGIVFNARDITERKRTEQTLRRSRKKYKELVNSLEGIVWEADAQTVEFTFVSDQAERLLGYPATRWTSEPTFWRDHIHPEDREWVVSYCAEATADKKDHELEYRMVAADGGVVWLRDIVTVVIENDEPVTLRGVMVDITERKRAEDDLRTSEERLSRIVETNTDGIALVDRNGKIIFANAAAEKIFGLTRSNIAASTYDDPQWTHTTIDGDPLPHEQMPFARVIRTGEPVYGVEFTLKRPDGNRRDVSVNGAPLRDAEGNVTGMVASFNDITERKRAEEEIEESRRALTTLMSNLPGMAYRCRNDEAWTMELVSEGSLELTGHAPEDLTGNRRVSYGALIHHDDREEVWEKVCRSP